MAVFKRKKNKKVIILTPKGFPMFVLPTGGCVLIKMGKGGSMHLGFPPGKNPP